MERKPIPLYMVDTINAYKASGHVCIVFPFVGAMALDGFPRMTYAQAYDKMTECLRVQAERTAIQEDI